MTSRDAWTACAAELEARRTRINNALDRLQADREGEGKSSAGDKYETGLEMLKQEEDKLDLQLAQLDEMEERLHRIEPAEGSAPGASRRLIRTDRGLYYVSIPLGKLLVGGEAVFCLSHVAPLSLALAGREVGETLTVNGVAHRVLAVE